MSVKELLRQQDAGFISLHDVLTKMTQIDGATYQEAATVLFRLIQPLFLKQEFTMWRVADKLRGAKCLSNGEGQDALECLTRAALHDLNSYEWTKDNNDIPFLTPRSDLDCFGFDLAEILLFLAQHGIRIGELPEAARLSQVDTSPAWKQIMSLLPVLNEHEAASAFVGLDLDLPDYLSDDEYTKLSKWQHVLVSAIHAKELIAEEADCGSTSPPYQWRIKPADLATWCAVKGVEYPLPSIVTLPATDAGLRKALALSERERTQWKVKAETLEAAGDQRASLQVEIEQLRGELRVKANEVVALEREQDDLKNNILLGKTRSTALKIIGGLVMQGYGMNIHAERLRGIDEMVKDLEKAGAAVTEKTLREWIKDAANVIDLPQKKD